MTAQMNTVHCQVLPAAFADEAATVMAHAFSDSPVYNFIFQHDQEYRRHALEWLFKRNLPLILRRCPSALRGVLNDKGEVVACFLWTPSPHQKLSTWDLLKAGMWLIPYRFDISTLFRLMKVVDTFDDAHIRFYDQEEEFCSLERMSVRPDYQGQGIGTKILKTVITQTSRTMRLETQEERNVRLYERLGYTVIGEIDFAEEGCDYKFHSWFMIIEQGKQTATEG